MPKTVITLPCTAQDLESALHAVCDTHGLWNGRIDTMCDGSDSGDACVSIVLSEGSGETSPSPSTTAPETHAAILKELRSLAKAMEMSLHPKDGWPTMSGMPIFVYLADLADRIEAAAKRERAEIEANALAVGGVVEASRNKPSGDAAAMREAWSKVVKCMDEILVRTELDSIIHRKALEAQNLADGALTELPRPATDEEVEAGDAQWCCMCRTECMLRGRDILVHGCARHNPEKALS